MSGSYFVLDSKYNTLLALALKGGSTVPDLQAVTDKGSVTTNDIRINNIADTTYNEITPTSILVSGGVTIADPLPNVYIQTTVGNSLSYMECYKDGTGLHAGMTVQLGDNYVKTTDQSLKITTNSTLKTQLDQSQLQFFGTGTGSLSSDMLLLDDGTNIISIDPTDITINGVSGVVGQVIGQSLTGINWVNLPPNDIPTLQEITEVVGGNTTTANIVMKTSGSTNTVNGEGISIIDDVTLSTLAEYSTNGMYLYQAGIMDNIQITPSIVLNTTEDGAINSGISSIYSSTTSIGFNNSFEVKHNMVGLSPEITQTLTENLGSPFNYNKNIQTPTNITLSSSLYAEQQSLDISTGLTVSNIQANSGSVLQVGGGVDFLNEVSFVNLLSPPHCAILPEFANDLCNKAYVDSRIASGGNNFLYFNYSIPSNPYIAPSKQLGTSIINAGLTTITIPQNGTNLISTFMTDVGVPYVTSIPAGLWELNQFGNVLDRKAGSTLFYQFVVSLYKPSTGISTVIGTSALSTDVNALVPTLYLAVAPIDTTPCALEDRIKIEVFSVGANNHAIDNIYSYYQDDYFSYLTCPLLTGANLLNLNNVWSGSNSFTNALTAPTQTFPSNSTNVATTAYLTSNYVNNSATQSIAGSKTFSDTTTNIGNMVILSNALNSNSINTDVLIGDNLIGTSISLPGAGLKIGQNLNWGVLNIGARTGRSGETHIHDGAFSSGSVYIGSHATTMNIAVQTTASANGSINIGSGSGSVGAFKLGSATRLLTVLGTSLSTISTGIITLLQTPTAYPTVGSTVPTTTWVSDAFTYFKTQAQTWDLAQTFTAQPLTNATIPAYPLFNTGLVSSTWVKNAINYAEKGKIISPALALTGTLTFANTYTVAPLVLLTVDMGSGTTIVSCALAGTTLVDFKYILSSLVGVYSLNYYVIVI